MFATPYNWVLVHIRRKGGVKMSMQRIGAFSTEMDAIHAANNLELKGFKADNIIIFTKNSSPKKMKQYTDVHVHSDYHPHRNEDRSLLNKMKTTFTNSEQEEETLNNYEKLIKLGFSKTEATKFMSELQTGYTLIIADDDDIRMGHPTPQTEVTQ